MKAALFLSIVFKKFFINPQLDVKWNKYNLIAVNNMPDNTGQHILHLIPKNFKNWEN